MRALFHLAADLEIEIEGSGPSHPNTSSNYVYVRTITGVDHERNEKHIERELCLSKSEARAVASAIMGCAAEL